MKRSNSDAADSKALAVTRRDVVVGSAGLGGLFAAQAFIPRALAAAAPPTAVLVNEQALRQKFPYDAASLLDSVTRFAQRQNGEIVRIDGAQSARVIKARLQGLSRRPRRLVIFGDESCIPRFAVKAPGGELQIDWFYGDLDGDGLCEVAIARVLGGPRAMANQLGEWGDPFRGRLITYSGPNGMIGEVREAGAGEWIENNSADSNRYRSVLETASEVVLQNRNNIIQFKLDLAARKTFWRRGNNEEWKHNYEIAEIMGKDSSSSTARYTRIVYRRREGPRTDFGNVRRIGSDRWIEINEAGSNSFRSTSETTSELVLQNLNNNIQFKLDLAARKCFWRRSATQSWQPNYDIIAVENADAPSGQVPSSSAIQSLVFASGPERHLEANALATIMGDLGCWFENRDWPDMQSLARAEVIYFCGHGNPNGWYGGVTGTIVTAARVPEFQNRPVVWAGACSTATPGAPLTRTFMDRGCRVYVGAASDSYGMKPATDGNELFMHFVDALRAHPENSMAELVAEARNRYVRNHGLAPIMLRLEKGESPSVGVVEAHTALQVMVFGDVTATHPRAEPKHCFSSMPFGANPISLNPGGSISRRFTIGAADGVPTLFFRGEWDRDVSARLQLEVMQNGELMHRLDWREQREYWAYSEGQAGAYWAGGRCHAFAVVPLLRRPGANEITLRVLNAPKPVQIRSETAVQKWPKRPASRLPAPRLARDGGRSLLWLVRDNDTGPMRGALTKIPRLHYLERRDFGDRLAAFEFPDEPEHLLDLADFDAILIDDVETGYRAFPRGMGAKVREFVRAGGGLVMTGGDDSFNGDFSYISHGGYGGTPIEEVLPVRMIRPDDRVVRRTTVGPITPNHPIAAGLTGPLPPILGYNQVAVKPGSTVLARTASGDPLLVVGQYGKGRVAAFMTRSNRDWGEEFKKWDQYNKFWENVIRWVVAA